MSMLWNSWHNYVTRSAPNEAFIVHLVLRNLVVIGPLANCIKVFALVLCHEIRERRVNFVDPNLAEDVEVSSTHKLLTDDIETVA